MKPGQVMSRNGIFLLLSVGAVALYFVPLRLLFGISWKSPLYSHVVLVPLVTIYLMASRRETIFGKTDGAFVPGGLLLAIAVSMFAVGWFRKHDLGENDYLSLTIFSFVVFIAGAFLLAYGRTSFKAALFPLCFLVFMVPVPEAIMYGIIVALQVCSTEVSHALFKFTGVPIARDGFTFLLPGMTIEVAEQCGGIRSSIALFITSILAGHLFLKTGWRKVILSAFVFPITIFKNGVRIVMLSLLGVYVDPRILGTDLHSRGGIPFFLVALALLGIVLWFLRRTEKATDGSLTR